MGRIGIEEVKLDGNKKIKMKNYEDVSKFSNEWKTFLWCIELNFGNKVEHWVMPVWGWSIGFFFTSNDYSITQARGGLSNQTVIEQQ